VASNKRKEGKKKGGGWEKTFGPLPSRIKIKGGEPFQSGTVTSQESIGETGKRGGRKRIGTDREAQIKMVMVTNPNTEPKEESERGLRRDHGRLSTHLSKKLIRKERRVLKRTMPVSARP